jgi:hypothetical protein
MSYKKTFILLVTDGTHGDVTACSNAAKLKWKEQFDEKLDTVPMGSTSSRVMIGTNKSFCDKGPEELTNVDEKDRLYILGHGSFGVSPTLGSKTADQLASYLYANGLRKVAVISLVSCNSGWGWGDILPGNVRKATQARLICRSVANSLGRWTTKGFIQKFVRALASSLLVRMDESLWSSRR